MRITIRSAVDLGLVVRAVRRQSRVRIDDLAGTAGVSKQFTQDVEHGKPTVQFGRVLKLLAELGRHGLIVPGESMRIRMITLISLVAILPPRSARSYRRTPPGPSPSTAAGAKKSGCIWTPPRPQPITLRWPVRWPQARQCLKSTARP